MPTSTPLEAWPEHTPGVLQVWSPRFRVIQEKPGLETQGPRLLCCSAVLKVKKNILV